MSELKGDAEPSLQAPSGDIAKSYVLEVRGRALFGGENWERLEDGFFPQASHRVNLRGRGDAQFLRKRGWIDSQVQRRTSRESAPRRRGEQTRLADGPGSRRSGFEEAPGRRLTWPSLRPQAAGLLGSRRAKPASAGRRRLESDTEEAVWAAMR